MTKVVTEPISEKEIERRKKEIMDLVDKVFAREQFVSEFLRDNRFIDISQILATYSLREDIDPIWMEKNFLTIKGKNLEDIENFVKERAEKKRKIKNIQQKVTDLGFLIDGCYYISD